MNIDENPLSPSKVDILAYYLALLDDCSAVMRSSLAGELATIHSEGHNYILDFSDWLTVLSTRPEVTLLRRAISEYQFALLALSLGQYRHAFMALRLFQELTLGAVHFSSNELELREWLRGEQDIRWGVIRDPDNGVFSKRFVKAFFEPLVETSVEYKAIAEKVYRECSEYVHGNAETNGALSDKVEFIKEVFLDWHTKAKSIRLIITYALCVRYIGLVNRSDLNTLESSILDQLGHLPEIRILFTQTYEDQ